MTISVSLGVLGRLLSLVGFAMTLQAIVAAIKPESILRILNKVLSKLEIPITIDGDYVIPLLMIAILLVYGSNWIVQYVRSLLMRRINQRIFSDIRNFAPQRVMDEDIFIIEQGPAAAQAAEKCMEVSLFIIMILTLFIFISPTLVLMLLPILAVLVVIQILGDRVKLRELKEQNDTRSTYINEFDPSGKAQKRIKPENNTYRQSLIEARENRRHRVAVKPQSDTFIGAIAIVVIIYYLDSLNLNSEYLAGLLILFVIGLRYIISAGIEMSASVSRLLELRRDIGMINEIVSTTFAA
ncbi:MAG: ABC transporter ATP-binding protein [Gammaproteobacteria bacterium]|nr:ABC transporter ATP-binding protein [Gammaproteobacteria bacterium]